MCAEYGLHYLANVDNKYIQKTDCVIWLMSINICEYGLDYLVNVNNKYVQNTACIIWLMSIIKLHSENDLCYLANVNK